jgi:hypothetical protein
LVVEYYANGKTYWHVTGFQAHQNPRFPSIKHPTYQDSGNIPETLPEDSGNASEGLRKHYGNVPEGEESRGEESKPIFESSVNGRRLPPYPPKTAENATRKGELCQRLRTLGIDCAPHLQAWAELLPHFSDEEIFAAAETAREKKPGECIHLNYLVPILRDRSPPKKPKEPPWWSSNETMLAKGKTLGMAPRPGEDWPGFRGRIQTKLSEGEGART